MPFALWLVLLMLVTQLGAGLSHALAASGFHLSVLVGTTLALFRRRLKSLRGVAGLGAMALFLALAGGQPSVSGACFTIHQKEAVRNEGRLCTSIERR